MPHFMGKIKLDIVGKIKKDIQHVEEKEKYILGILIAFAKNDKAKVKAVGKTIDLLTLLVAVSKCLAERISKEKGVSLEKAEDIVVDCIKDGIKTIKE